MERRGTIKRSAVTLVVAALATGALAQSQNMTFSGQWFGTTGYVKYQDADSHWATENVVIGKLKFNVAGSPDPLWTVCGDLDHFLDGGTHPYTPQLLTGAGSTGMDRAARIVGPYFATSTSALDSAALQLAVWEAITDNGSTPNFGTGRFQVPALAGSGPLSATWATIQTQASSYYAAPSGRAWFYASSANGAQSQLAPAPNPVPEPVTSALALGGVGLALRRRRRVRSA